MYRVRWINFDYYSQDEFDQLEQAMQYVDSKGFEASVEKDGEIVASKSTFSGWKQAPAKLVPRSFTEIRTGDWISVKTGFQLVEAVIKKTRYKTTVKFAGVDNVVVFSGLIFTKG